MKFICSSNKYLPLSSCYARYTRLEEEEEVGDDEEHQVLGGGDTPPDAQFREEVISEEVTITDKTAASTSTLILNLEKADGHVEGETNKTRLKQSIEQLDGHSSCALEVTSESSDQYQSPVNDAFSLLVEERKKMNRKIRSTFCNCKCGCLWCNDGTGPTELGEDWQYPDTGQSLDIVICCDCHN